MQKKAILIFSLLALSIISIIGGIIYLLSMPTQKSQLKSSIIQPQQGSKLTGENILNKNTNPISSLNFSGTISILIPAKFKSQSLHRFFSQYSTGDIKIKISYLTSSIWNTNNSYFPSYDIMLLPSPLAINEKNKLLQVQSNLQINNLFFYPVQEWIQKQGMLLIPFAIDIPVLYVSPYLNKIYPLSRINIKNLKEILLIAKKIDNKGNPINYPILIGIDKLTYHLLKREKFNLFPDYNIWLFLFSKQSKSPQEIAFIFKSSYTNWSYYNLQKEFKICKRVYKINDLRSCLLKRKKTYIVPGFVSDQKLFKDFGVKIFPLSSNEEYPIIIRGWGINKNISKNKLTQIQYIFKDYLKQGSSMYGWRPNSLSAFQKALIYQQNYSRYQNLQLIRDVLVPSFTIYPGDIKTRLKNLEF